jgi:hypothetical protein
MFLRNVEIDFERSIPRYIPEERILPLVLYVLFSNAQLLMLYDLLLYSSASDPVVASPCTRQTDLSRDEVQLDR